MTPPGAIILCNVGHSLYDVVYTPTHGTAYNLCTLGIMQGDITESLQMKYHFVPVEFT